MAIGTTKAMAGKLTAPFVSKVKFKSGKLSLCSFSIFTSFMLNIFLMKVVAAGGGAAAGSVAGPLGTLGGAVVSMVRV